MTGPGQVVWIDGAIVDRADARVSPTDHAVTVGDGVFETCKIMGDVPFALSRHLARLQSSAAAMSIDMPDEAMLRRAAHAICAADAGGTKLRLKGRGVPATPRKPAGDQYVVLRVVPPKDLTDEQKERIGALADVLGDDPRAGLEWAGGGD